MSAQHTPGPWRVEFKGEHRGFVAIRRYPYDGVAVHAEWLDDEGKVVQRRHPFLTADEARAAIAKATGSTA